MDIKRNVARPTEELLSGFRAIVVNGPCQAGKSTRVRQVQRARGPVITLDDPWTERPGVARPLPRPGTA